MGGKSVLCSLASTLIRLLAIGIILSSTETKTKYRIDGFSVGRQPYLQTRCSRIGLGTSESCGATTTAMTLKMGKIQQVVDDTLKTNNEDDFIIRDIEAHDSILPTLEEISAFSIPTTLSTPAPQSSGKSTNGIKRREPRPFPIGMIIDQQEIKHALLLAAVNPKSIGVLISGGRGTGKSVLARAMQRIIPSHIRRIKHSEYNIDPEGKNGIDSFLLHQLEREDNSLESMETELIPSPFVQIPLGIMEDNLIGTVDLEQSLETGITVFSPGLLAKAHRGILYVDEINLLEDDVVDTLLKVLSDGYVTCTPSFDAV